MKKFLILLLCAAALGLAGWYFVRRADAPGMTDRARDLAGRTRQTAVGVKDQAADSARELGGYLGDVGIITLLKGKYAAEKDLSALAITIECRDGHVTLRGSVESAGHIARAVTLAPDQGCGRRQFPADGQELSRLRAAAVDGGSCRSAAGRRSPPARR